MTNLLAEVISRHLARPVILFGAGHGTQLLLEHLERAGRTMEIRFLVDNDRSMWGRRAYGREIRDPQAVRAEPDAVVLVTSISGREAIAAELEAMGRRRGEGYDLVVTYGGADEALLSFAFFTERLAAAGRGWRGARVLHVGPGGFLGVEVLAAAAGGSTVDAVDLHSWGLAYPDVSDRAADYAQLVRQAPPACDPARFPRLLLAREGRLFLEPQGLRLRFPHTVESLPFPDGAFDLSLSLSVLEHVLDPAAAARELVRTLAPGGVSIHRVTTRDHRAFSDVPGYDPFSFRRMPAVEWEALARAKFYQNRVAPAEWRRLLEAAGARVLDHRVLERRAVTADEASAFDEPFRRLPLAELGEIDCDIVFDRV